MTSVASIAAAFRGAMPYCWPTSRTMSRLQLRDLIRVFVMGYGEAILAECPDGESRFCELNETLAALQSPNWLPGPEWHWGPNDAA